MQLSWSPDVFYDVITMSVVDDLDCFGCIAIDLQAADGSPADIPPGLIGLQGETIAEATPDFSAPPPRSLDTVSESLVATHFWGSQLFEFDDDAVGWTYTGVATMFSLDGNPLTQPAQVTIQVDLGELHDVDFEATLVIDDTWTGTLDVNIDDRVLVTGTVDGDIVLNGGTVRLDGSTLVGDLYTVGEHGSIQFGVHESYGDFVIDSDVTTTAVHDDNHATFHGSLLANARNKNAIFSNKYTFTAEGSSFLGSLVIDGGDLTIDGHSTVRTFESGMEVNGGNFHVGGSSTVIINAGGDLSISGDVSAGSDIDFRTRGGGDISIDSQGSVTALVGLGFSSMHAGGTIDIDGTVTAGEVVDIRPRGDNGGLTVNGTVEAGTHLDLRTTGTGSDLTVNGDIFFSSDADLKTTGDNASLHTGLPTMIASDEFGPGRIFLQTRGSGSDLTIDKGLSFSVDVDYVDDTEVRVTGDDSDLIIDAALALPTGFDARVTGDGGDMIVNDVIQAEGDIDLRVTGGGEMNLGGGVDAGSANVTVLAPNSSASCGVTFLTGCAAGNHILLRTGGDLTVNGAVNAAGDVTMRTTDGGDLTVNDTISASEGEIFLRTANGGNIDVPCDLTAERGICLFDGASIEIDSDGAATIGADLVADIVDLNAGDDLTVDGNVDAADLFAYGGGGYRGASYTRIGSICTISGLVQVDGGGGSVTVDGTVIAGDTIDISSDLSVSVEGSVNSEIVLRTGGDINLDSGTTTTINGTLSAQTGSVDLYAGEGTSFSQGVFVDWDGWYAEFLEDSFVEPGYISFEPGNPDPQFKTDPNSQSSSLGAPLANYEGVLADA